MSVTVVDAPERSRYEISVDGALAGFAVYRLAPGRVIFVHTEIDDAYAGHGLGGKLARAALDDVRAPRPRRATGLPVHQGVDRQAPGLRRPRGLTAAARPAANPTSHPFGPLRTPLAGCEVTVGVRSDGRGEPGLPQPLHPGQPPGVCRVELVERLRCPARIWPGLVRRHGAAEMSCRAFRDDHARVRDPGARKRRWPTVTWGRARRSRPLVAGARRAAVGRRRRSPRLVGGPLAAHGPATPVRGRSGSAHRAASRQARHAHAAAPLGSRWAGRVAGAGARATARAAACRAGAAAVDGARAGR